MKTSIRDLRIVFFGTSSFAEIAFEALRKQGIQPALLVTAPDKPQGRNLVVTPPEAKVWAEKHDIEILQPEKITEGFINELANTDWDVFVVASYGKILPKKLIDLPKYRTLNIHPSLLPKLRGPSPIQSSILTEKETGITIMLIDEEVDHGPIIAQAKIDMDPWPIDAMQLTELLATEGGNLLAEALPLFVRGEITPEEQDHDKATFTKKITKIDGELDLTKDPYENYKKFLAFKGWPGTYFFTTKRDKKLRVKITEAAFENGQFVITKVIPEGKKEMEYGTFTKNIG